MNLSRIDRSFIGKWWRAKIETSNCTGCFREEDFDGETLMQLQYSNRGWWTVLSDDNFLDVKTFRLIGPSRTRIPAENIKPGDWVVCPNGPSRWAIVIGICLNADGTLTFEALIDGIERSFDFTATPEEIIRKRGPRKLQVAESRRYKTLTKEGKELGAKGFCGPLAYAVITGCGMEKAFKDLRGSFKPKGGGMRTGPLKAAIEARGFKLERLTVAHFNPLYPTKYVYKKITSHHPRRWPNHWPKGTFLCVSSNHFFTIVDGEVIDFTINRSYPINSIFKVTK